MNDTTTMQQDETLDFDPFAGGALQRVAPATPSQVEIWLADRLAREASLAYNESESFLFEGPLNVEALAAALQQLIQRHDALRSTIGPDGLSLCVSDHDAIELSILDFSDLDPDEQLVRVASCLRRAVETPFALEHGPLLRAELLRLGVTRHQLVLTAHHAVCDGWSWGILKRELAVLYTSRLKGRSPQPPLVAAPSFADYAERQAEQAEGAQAKADREFWNLVHAAGVPLLELPLDRPRPPLRTFKGGFVSHRIDANLITQVRRLAARDGASLFSALFASFAVLIGRLCNQTDVIVGMAAAGQSVDGNEDLVGHAVSLLPMRVGWSDGESFSAILQRAQSHVFDAMEHLRLSYGDLLKSLHVPRDPSRPAMVSVVFNIDQPVPADQMQFHGLTTQTCTNPRSFENFELFVNAIESPDGLTLQAQFNADLFDASTVARWLEAFEHLLKGLATSMAQPVHSLQWLTATDAALLQLWNATDLAQDEATTLSTLLPARMREHAARPAVLFGDQVWSMAELQSQANRLAHLLRSRGIGRGSLVGLCLERSPRMLAAQLGVLWSGAAYVPLDPAYPIERLSYKARDAALALVLTDAASRSRLDWRAELMLDLDQLADALAALPDTPLPHDPARAARASDPAYVIYTSGSTGNPKGVSVPHGAVVNFLTSMARQPGMTAADRILAVTTISFDIAVLELLLPLTVGASLVLATREQVMDGAALRELLEQRRVTMMQATPSMWRMLLSAGWRGAAGFKALTGGEALATDLAQQLQSRCAELWNMYGPTETTVWSSCARIDADAPSISIGTPIANTQIHVLDAQQRICPVGVPGEIYIAGTGVALGYLNRPELNAERFVANPFATRDGERMYRTGDLGRWLNRGVLEHLGRLDYQVKVRGYRIELGEIEAALAAHFALAGCVVVVREDSPGDPRIVAYLVAPGENIATAQLRERLRQTLPEFMVPQNFVWLDALPLLPNGKINRNALPAPSETGPGKKREIRLPSSAMEQSLAKLWRELLRVEQVSADDNFIALGGHSLLLMRMASQVKSQLGLTLPVREYFIAPTLADLACRLEALTIQAALHGRIVARPGQDRAPLSLMQERLWFMESLHPGRPFYHIEGGLRLHGRLDAEALDRAVQALLARQSSLRTVFDQADDNSVSQRVLPSYSSPLLPAEDLTALPSDQAEATLLRRIGEIANRTFELRGRPLLRLRLFKLSADEHVFLLLVHHLIFDGWSMTVLLRELAELYRAECQGHTARLPALSVSYGDFAVWQQAWAQGSVARAHIAHWCQKLSSLGEPLALPTDHARPPEPSHKAGAVHWRLAAPTTAALKALGQSEDATLFMVMLAGYYALLQRHTGQTDFVVGFPVRGRNDAELEDLVGFFANVLPLRLTVRPEQSFRVLLRNTRLAVLEALTHADAPFEQVVRQLKLPRDESRFPVYQTLFAFQDTRDATQPWGDIQTSALTETVEAVVEDLAVWMVEASDGLAAKLAFATDLFEAASIEDLAERYGQLLQSAVLAPDCGLGELHILTPSEESRLREWNATDLAQDEATTLSTLLPARMREHAARPAVLFGDQVWSMAELQSQANRLAHLLRSRGIGRGSLVGLCLERSPRMLAAQLGVLWSGAAYVPLDPAYPIERLSYKARDAALALVLTDAASRSRLDWRAELMLDLDQLADALAALPDTPLPHDPARAARASDPAYVIYTSGSTGNPKGVSVPHGAVVNFLTSMARQPGMTAADRILAVTTISFDIAVLELLLPLTVGASLVLATREQVMDGAALRELLEQRRVTMMQATPSMWRMLLSAGWRGAAGFKALTGGEALATDLAQQLQSRCAELWNMYGPTETTVWSSCARIDADAPSISIGTPIANTQIHVLDAQQRICPVGVPGEIYIAGTGVALGYLNRPELNAERFVANPFATRDGERMYRTGDLGRWLNRGVLEHLGRLDYQVKVRGYRIELGEIEAALAAHFALAGCVVVVREDSPGDPRIVAYLVAPGENIATAQLRERLRQTLPEFMVPQNFVWLDALPLLPNGKINRNALPAPETPETTGPVHDLGTHTEQEHAIAQIWSRLLGVSGITPSDNFFDLGGHSLLAMQALAEMQRQLGRSFELRELIFESLAAIAAARPVLNRAAEPEKVKPRPGLTDRLIANLKSKVGSW